MTTPNGAMLYTQGFGSRPENVEIPIIQTRAPTAQDTQNGFLPLGKRWVDKTNNAEYALTSFSSVTGALQATWIFLGSSAGSLISVIGTTNQIDVITISGVAILTIATTFVAPGSVTATTSLTATNGNITATNGNLVLSNPGNKLVINAATPTASSVGTTDAMILGAVTITSSAITASSKIIYSRRTLGTAMGNVSITAQAGGSAILTSDEGTETSTFDYLIIN